MRQWIADRLRRLADWVEALGGGPGGTNTPR